MGGKSVSYSRYGVDCAICDISYEKNSARRQALSCLGTIRCSHVRFSRYIRWIVKKVHD